MSNSDYIFNGIRKVYELVRKFFFYLGVFHGWSYYICLIKPFKLFDASFLLSVWKKP